MMSDAVMMPYPLALAGFLLLVSLLMLLPLLPAWQEWRHPSDCAALPIPRGYTSDTEFFAADFRRQILLEGATRTALSPSSFDYLRVPVEQVDWRAARRPIISSDAIRIREAIRCVQPLFVRTDLDVDQGSRFNAVLATGALRLGPQCEVHHWAHADGALHLGSHGIGMRRLSSRSMVELDDGCLFERISAPTVRFGRYPQPIVPSLMTQRPQRCDYVDLPHARRRSAALVRIDGDCILPPGRLYIGSLLVTGHLAIGEDTIVLGDVKARKGILIGRHASVEGAVICEESIDVRSGAMLHGPVVAERGVTLAAGSRVGDEERHTTISAATILAEAGACAHGSLWAREAGLVWAT